MTMLARLCVDCPQNWDELLPFVLFAHRTAVSRATGVSPYEMLYGRVANTPLEATLMAGVDNSARDPDKETTTPSAKAMAYRQQLAETLLYTFDFARRHELEHYRPVTKPQESSVVQESVTPEDTVKLPTGISTGHKLTAQPRQSMELLTPGTRVRVYIPNIKFPAKFAQHVQGGWVVEELLPRKRVALVRNGGTTAGDRHIACLNDVAMYDPDENLIRAQPSASPPGDNTEVMPMETVTCKRQSRRENSDSEDGEWEQLPPAPMHTYGTRAKVLRYQPQANMYTATNCEETYRAPVRQDEMTTTFNSEEPIRSSTADPFTNLGQHTMSVDNTHEQPVADPPRGQPAVELEVPTEAERDEMIWTGCETLQQLRRLQWEQLQPPRPPAHRQTEEERIRL